MIICSCSSVHEMYKRNSEKLDMMMSHVYIFDWSCVTVCCLVMTLTTKPLSTAILTAIIGMTIPVIHLDEPDKIKLLGSVSKDWEVAAQSPTLFTHIKISSSSASLGVLNQVITASHGLPLHLECSDMFSHLTTILSEILKLTQLKSLTMILEAKLYPKICTFDFPNLEILKIDFGFNAKPRAVNHLRAPRLSFVHFAYLPRSLKISFAKEPETLSLYSHDMGCREGHPFIHQFVTLHSLILDDSLNVLSKDVLLVNLEHLEVHNKSTLSLFTHLKTPNLRSLTLKNHNHLYLSDSLPLQQLIKLDISLSIEGVLHLPYSMPSLQFLHLRYHEYNPHEIADIISFPSLRHLCITYEIGYPCKQTREELQPLLKRFPTLDTFEIRVDSECVAESMETLKDTGIKILEFVDCDQ